MRAIVTNPNGAPVIDWNGVATGATIPFGTEGNTGLEQHGTFDVNGKPIDPQYDRSEFYPDTDLGLGNDLWVDWKDIQLLPEAEATN